MVTLVLVLAFVLPPLVNINRFHLRIANSISAGIGHPVRMSAVKMHLLPRPGFEIADFVVEEDPAFGAEPMVRCAEVTAYVRLLSLWRGRLEIARIGFDEPSLNLVRNAQGKWNFDSLLSQASRVPNAPTAERHAGRLPRFPYIDASNARVNFKVGNEKMPFSFLNADLAVWLANPDEWRVKFVAQPVRTDLDLDLANTGILRLEGSLGRAASISQMPVSLHAEWSNAPLGQLSRIVTGSDAGWRGELDVAADITGSADEANVKVLARGSGIHRSEFEPREPLNLDTTCVAHFGRAARTLDAITCLAPTGAGHLLLTGSIKKIGSLISGGGPSWQVEPALSLEINHLPVGWAFDGVRLIRSGFAPAVLATGTIDGNFSYATEGTSSPPAIQGHAVVNNLTVAAPALAGPITLPALHFAMAAEGAGSVPPRHSVRNRPSASLRPLTDQVHALLLEPFSIGQASLRGQAPALPASLNLSGAFTRAGFRLHIDGQSQIGETLALGREFGLLGSRAVSFGPQGTADLNVNIHGPWLMPVGNADHPVNPATIDGSLRLRNARVLGSFLAQPLLISSAVGNFDGDRIDWTASSMSYGPLHADGTLSYPAYCEGRPECARNFTLKIGSIDAATAQNALLGVTTHGEILQQLLGRLDVGRSPDFAWPAMTGTVQIGSVKLQGLSLDDLSARVAIAGHAVQVTSLTGRALDGVLHLAGTMELLSGTPHYAIEAQLEHGALSAAAGVFQEDWGPGWFDLKTKLQLSGFEAKQLISSASGTFHWDWEDGGLRIPDAEDEDGNTTTTAPRSSESAQFESLARFASLTHFQSWIADGNISGQTFKLSESAITSGAETLLLVGTIDFARRLDLSSAAKPAALTITGTLEHPKAGGGAGIAPGR